MRNGWLAAIPLLVPLLQGGDWAALWQQLERLQARETNGPEAEALRSSLREAALTRPGDPRAELLQAVLEQLAGHDTSRVASRLAALEPSPFAPRERWFLAAVLPPGPERARQLLEALADPAPLSRWQLLLAWNAAVEEARSLRLTGTALSIQEDLHRRYQADWSAVDLALTRRWLGDARGADEVLAGAIARESAEGRPAGDLWSQRGILALGSGDEQRGRDYLGRALALGSGDANLVLSRLDLAQGRLEAARRGFRASILDTPPADWAWRGWGMTLLPSAWATPAPRHRTPPDNE